MGKKRVSFSQYKLFKKCPLAYKFQYIDRIGEWKENIHLIFGTAMHDTVQSYLYLLYNRDTFDEDDEVNGVRIGDYLIRKNDHIIDFDVNTLLKDRMYEEVQKIDEEVRSDRVTKDELVEFYTDGVYILDYLKRKRKDWFTVNGWELEGIEFKLSEELKEDVDFIGYIDILLKDPKGNYHIIDLKTSTKSWGYWKKNDTVATNQNLFYKHLLSNKLDIPMNKINVEYLILKRKVNNIGVDEIEQMPEESRLQRFIPSNGIISVNKAVQDFQQFLDFVFVDGERDDTKEYEPNPTKFNCTYCDFREMGVCDYVHEDAKNV